MTGPDDTGPKGAGQSWGGWSMIRALRPWTRRRCAYRRCSDRGYSCADMIALRTATHFLTGEPVDRDTRRARLLAARRKPVGSVTRRGILSGHWDQGTVVGAFRGGRGSFRVDQP